MKNKQKIEHETLSRIRQYLQTLKLYKIDEIFDKELERAQKENSPFITVFERLLSVEAASFMERRIERRIKESGLPERKLLTDFDFDFQTGIDRAQIMELSTLGFVERNNGLILAGNSGTGKSHIAKSLLLLGCQRLYQCRYTTAANMLKELMSGLADDTLDRKLKIYTRPEILLIDEIGFDRLEQESARNASLFFKVIDGRYTKKPTILTTNIDFKALGDYLGDPVITTALVDRMVHHAIIIHIEGPSFRIHESKALNSGRNKISEKKQACDDAL